MTKGEAERRQLSELQVVALAGCVAVTCVWPIPVSVTWAAVALLGAMVVGRPWLVMAAVVVVASGRATGAVADYQPLASDTYEGAVQLVTDPTESRFGWTAEGRLIDGANAGARVRLSFPWSASSVVADATAGQGLSLSGQISPIDQSSWSRARHLLGRLSVASAQPAFGVPWWQRPSEALRVAVRRGAAHLPASLQPLYMGLVIGDDREQSDSQRAQFRAAGLSHLLAVSGQNVAFVLAVGAPLIRRCGRSTQLVATCGLLVVFAMATRLEPSVMRATVSAGIAAGSIMIGRRAAGARTLGLTVTALLIIDPLLVWSIGFALSVLASAGIVMLGPVLVARIRGPKWWAEAVGITFAAQLFVAPLLIVVFGPMSVVALPANLLAGWAAGAVMTWGLTLGILAGVLPEGLGILASLPAAALVWWIDAVAGWASQAPLPRIGMAGLVAMALTALGWWATPNGIVRTVVLGIAIVGSWSLVPQPPRSGELVAGAYWSEQTESTLSLLVVPARAPRDLVEVVVAMRIGAIDVVIVERGNRTVAGLVRDLTEVTDVGVILAPPQHRITQARRVTEPMAIVASGGATVFLEPIDEKLDVKVMSGGVELLGDGP